MTDKLREAPADKPLEVRSYQLRAATLDESKREVRGIAVPWGQVADIGGYYKEVVERGAVVDSDDALAFSLHETPVGLMVRHADVDEGWDVTLKLSETSAGNDALTLARDGVLRHFSVGFTPIENRDEWDEDGNLTRYRTKIKVREVSLVPFPAYEGATITEVRNAAPTTKKGTGMDPELMEKLAKLASKDELTELRQTTEDIQRLVQNLPTGGKPEDEGDQFRSFGEYVKLLAKGDERAKRAYEGATTGDTVLKDSWLQGIYRIMAGRQRVLSRFQHAYTLPSEGMNVEYGLVESDTTQVGVQAAEGDNLLFGKVAVTSDSAPVHTLGGWSSLSRQAIERTSVNVLDLTFTALANKYARAIELLTRQTITTHLGTAGARSVEGDLSTQDGIVTWLLDLVEFFDDHELNLDGVFVGRDVFRAIYAVPATDRVLQVSGAPTDKVGTIAIKSLSGDVANIPFSVFPGAASGTAFGYDQLAVKTLEAPGAPMRLQDENVVNLTKDFSVYGYASSFVQFEDGLVKLAPEA